MASVKSLSKILGCVVSTGALSGVLLSKSKNEHVWSNVNMPLIRLLDAEKAHKLAVQLASYGMVPSFATLAEDHEVLKTDLWGLSFDTPIGLAAGFDKHAECMNGMLKMGFAFVEVGSITPKPQIGNPKPRNFRLLEDDAVINRYGFNSHGHAYAKENISKYLSNCEKNGVVAVNLGKNKESSDAVDDYVKGVIELGELADYLVINISSPNTPGLRGMQGRDILKELVGKVLEARKSLKKQPPLLVKIAPDLEVKDKEDIAAVVSSFETRVDGLIVSNTTVKRPSYLQSEHKAEVGGLSGKPVKELSTECIRDMYVLTNGDIPIIGVGGVASGQDAFEKICNGASLVQLYSSLSLQGPPVVDKVKRELANLLRKNGFSNTKDAVGSKVVNAEKLS